MACIQNPHKWARALLKARPDGALFRLECRHRRRDPDCLPSGDLPGDCCSIGDNVFNGDHACLSIYASSSTYCRASCPREHPVGTIILTGRALSASTGEYNEQAFQALDHILDEAAKLGMRVILALGDNWIAADSKPTVRYPPPPPPPPPLLPFSPISLLLPPELYLSHLDLLSRPLSMSEIPLSCSASLPQALRALAPGVQVCKSFCDSTAQLIVRLLHIRVCHRASPCELQTTAVICHLPQSTCVR